jgi:cell division protein FtsW
MTAPAFATMDGALPLPDATRTELPAGVRERWRMSVSARALVMVTLILLALGVSILFSASIFEPLKRNNDASAMFLRQLRSAGLGVIAFMIAAKLDAERYKRLAWPGLILAGVLLLAVFLPGMQAYGGSRRALLSNSLQPGELAKLAVVIWVSMLIVRKGDQIKTFTHGVRPFILVIGTLAGLVALEPDFSTAAMYIVLTGLLLFTGGARIRHLAAAALLAIPAGGLAYVSSDYVQKRVQAWLVRDQKTSAQDVPEAAQQQRQSLIAIGSGGIFGVGLAEGNQQRQWLPLPYNDFIAAVIGEELGFLGLVGITALFVLYGWLGFRIARAARTPFQRSVAIGLTGTIVMTALIHIGVAIELLPNTGLTLPFVSYGGSNLAISLLMTGILVNIGSVRERVRVAAASDPLTAGPH